MIFLAKNYFLVKVQYFPIFVYRTHLFFQDICKVLKWPQPCNRQGFIACLDLQRFYVFYIDTLSTSRVSLYNAEDTCISSN